MKRVEAQYAQWVTDAQSAARGIQQAFSNIRINIPTPSGGPLRDARRAARCLPAALHGRRGWPGDDSSRINRERFSQTTSPRQIGAEVARALQRNPPTVVVPPDEVTDAVLYRMDERESIREFRANTT